MSDWKFIIHSESNGGAPHMWGEIVRPDGTSLTRGFGPVPGWSWVGSPLHQVLLPNGFFRPAQGLMHDETGHEAPSTYSKEVILSAAQGEAMYSWANGFVPGGVLPSEFQVYEYPSAKYCVGFVDQWLKVGGASLSTSIDIADLDRMTRASSSGLASLRNIAAVTVSYFLKNEPPAGSEFVALRDGLDFVFFAINERGIVYDPNSIG